MELSKNRNSQNKSHIDNSEKDTVCFIKISQK